MHASDLEYDLPTEFIAQHPAARRDASRLLVLDRSSGGIRHETFSCLPKHLRNGDVLVLNNTRVLPARLIGRRSSGGKIDVLLVREVRAGLWETLLTGSRRLRENEPLEFEEGALNAAYRGHAENGLPLIEFDDPADFHQRLADCGRAPLPPYIKRQAFGDDSRAEDLGRYQTVYADKPGAIAAPTAGLHYTPELLEEVGRAGVTIETITLHVGPGTFKPVKAETVEEHRVDPEYYEVPEGLPERLLEARAAGRRIVAVGTTSCRVLESLARMPQGRWQLSGWTNLFIYPPFEFRWVTALQTNFHLPRSSLLALVFAFAGRERVLEAYEQAKTRGYRFYSYGDAMLIV